VSKAELWSVTLELCKGDQVVAKLDISDPHLKEILEALEKWLEILNAD